MPRSAQHAPALKIHHASGMVVGGRRKQTDTTTDQCSHFEIASDAAARLFARSAVLTACYVAGQRHVLTSRQHAYWVRGWSPSRLSLLFQEIGEREGVYHTADATLWFFHALDRYLEVTHDRATLTLLLPKLLDIVEHHWRGTRFGIGVDPRDGLLSQGQEGYQLTWMDAKVGDWVVTPRRGKAVEINALWYNALRLLEGWVRDEEGERAAAYLADYAERARASFNERFWYSEGGYLYDVIDGP